MELPHRTELSPLEQQKRRALLAKIAQFEARGAILPIDARTLRSQLHDSTSGQWKAVEVRLQQLARSWNPYQDGNSTKKEKKKLDFYQLLELENDAKVTTEDVKKQFRKLALLLHPDKKRASRKRERESKDEDDELDENKLREVDSTQFARLRLAYETLSDPERRSAYDVKLLEADHPQQSQQVGEVVKGQVKLEASTDFASLEWMARVKHKMDVMAKIAEWAKLLSLNATELRFETGEPCTGKGCGKIVSMDRDLECSGSPRRRVYICLLHKYIHACDENCTSTFGDAELDQRVCPMRAYWLIQNWLFDQLQAAALHHQMQTPLNSITNELEHEEPASKKVKLEAIAKPSTGFKEENCAPAVCGFEQSEIHLGDQYTRFKVEKIADCHSGVCRSNFQFLEDGVYACRQHGTPHICTFEQCDRQELRMGSYICWVSGKLYGCEREQAGTDVRTRRVIYSGAHGDENSVEMEVPVMLPLGKTTRYLLEGDPSVQHSGDVSSLSPPPPEKKAWNKRQRANSDSYDHGANGNKSPKCEMRKKFKRNREREQETSPVRKRLHERLESKIQRAETTSFHIFLKLPPAVAILPKVALELEEAAGSSSDDEESQTKTAADKENLLQIFVNSHHTVNYIKYWMEELTEQQLSIWDQQIYWGCVLELRLHDDCPLLVSTWNGKNAAAGGCGGAPVEYNTVQISKEAAEDLDDLQDEWENVIAAEEQAFENSRLQRKREKLELRGAIEHTEVLRYDNVKTEPRLIGVIQKRALDDSDGRKQMHQLVPPSAGLVSHQTALVSIKSEVLVKEEQEQVPKGVEAMRLLSNDAQPVREAQKTRKQKSSSLVSKHQEERKKTVDNFRRETS
ncbi:Tetratricopeptide [Phytophthora palmivora]|uniref:Tetratricopeptide n=1 Tax=Phytophthora palmivora TaxID=4796 RepID=A0A2P4WX81_9STRA|nr:Tetratricopeptide [Phytophthora palmivora]